MDCDLNYDLNYDGDYGYGWLQQGLCTIDELRAREDLCRPVLPAPRIRLEIVRDETW